MASNETNSVKLIQVPKRVKNSMDTSPIVVSAAIKTLIDSVQAKDPMASSSVAEKSEAKKSG